MTRTLPSPAPGSAAIPLRTRAWHVLRAGLLGAAAVTVAGLGVHYVLDDASFEVHTVRFVGMERAAPEALRHLSDLRTGTHLATADLQRAVAGVERHPWVARAEARRVFPGTIEVRVEEHAPVLLLAADGLWYLDGEGRPFKQARTDDLDYPVLTGLDGALLAERPTLAAAATRAAVHTLAAAEPLGAEAVSEVHLDLERGFTVVLRSGSQLVLGWTDPGERFERIARMVDAGLDLDTPHRVDLGGADLAIATPLSG